MINKVYIDLDGVLADFLGAVLRLLRLPFAAYETLANGGPSYGTLNMLVGGDNNLWDQIRREGERFWREMELIPQAKTLVNKLEKRFHSNVYLLTAYPYSCPHAASGKLLWVKDHFPRLSARVILCPAAMKREISKPTSVLIDDHESNVREWREDGGIGYVYPSQWRTLRHPNEGDVFDVLAYINGELQ